MDMNVLIAEYIKNGFDKDHAEILAALDIIKYYEKH